MSQTLQIEELVDGQKFGRFNINLLLWSFLAMISDGYDIAALASAAPALARTWHLAPIAFAPALSASLFGILLGAPLLGYVGDRFGRRLTIVAGCTVYGLGTLATAWATGLDQVVALRFLTGIGLGGLMPNTIALNSELAPKRLRATLIVLMFTGITLGGGLPGYIQAWLIPLYGWRIMFWIGGLLPLLVATCLLFSLPESVKYLALRSQRHRELLAMVRRLRRDLTIADDAQFVIAPAPRANGTGLKQIFSGGLAWITPLLWLCFVCALMANFFLNSWLPLIFENSGLTPNRAASRSASTTMAARRRSAGQRGARPIWLAVIALLFLLAAPAIAAIGVPGVLLYDDGIGGGTGRILYAGAQFGNNAASGLLYPTAFRSRGVGWALGIGGVGSIAARWSGDCSSG